MRQRIAARLEDLVFGHRRLIIGLFIITTLVLGHQATRLQGDASFEKQLPVEHPFMRTFFEYQREFGGANRLLIAVRARDGEIFNARFLATAKEVTEAVFFLPGVNRSSVRSIFTPNARFVEVVEGGFVGGNVIPPGFQPTPRDIARVRENVVKAGIVGRLVANDFSAAMVSADLLELDSATGQRLDYLQVAHQLESDIRQRFVDDATDIHIIGFVKAVGDIADGAKGVVTFFVATIIVTGLLVWIFTHSARLAALPLVCSLIAVLWTLGLLPVLGFGLDPMSILVPFLIFAIGVSHGVQMINAARTEVLAGAGGPAAARGAFRQLLLPSSVALVTDTAGFLMILLIEIPIIQELAITAAIGVAVIILTNLLLLPVLLSHVGYGERYRRSLVVGARRRERLWRLLARVVRPPLPFVILAAALMLFLGSLLEARHVRIGDLSTGVPELRPDSRYNRDAGFIAGYFSIGVDIFRVIVETRPDACVDYSIMAQIDRFAWHMTNVPGVRSTMSLPQVAKDINAGWYEGSPKWRVLPRDATSLAQAVSPVETSTGLLNRDCSVMPVVIFTEDHTAETIARVVEAIQAYQPDGEDDAIALRLATGNVGVMAAVNQVVAEAQMLMLLYIYMTVILLCLATFRSIYATLCIVLPLALVSVLAYALMTRLGIGLKVSTLPVIALGVGIGVDYGIYIFSRLKGMLDRGAALGDAYLQTLRVTGDAVLVTGLTLALGTSTWIFSDLQFHADMGLLLTFMLLANMVGALVILPCLALLLRWSSAGSPGPAPYVPATRNDAIVDQAGGTRRSRPNASQQRSKGWLQRYK